MHGQAHAWTFLGGRRPMFELKSSEIPAMAGEMRNFCTNSYFIIVLSLVGRDPHV